MTQPKPIGQQLREIRDADREAHNERVRSVADEIEFEPLKEFILSLLEDEP